MTLSDHNTSSEGLHDIHEYDPLDSLLEPYEPTEDPVEMVEHQGFLARNKVKLALGATAVSTAITAGFSPVSETMQQLGDTAPLVAGSVLGAEVAWIGGAAMMLASVGTSVKNPLKIRKHLSDIATRANNSNLFKAGFWINTAAATTQFIVPTAVIMSELPPRTWGVLSLLTLDFAATVTLRQAILAGVRNNSVKAAE